MQNQDPCIGLDEARRRLERAVHESGRPVGSVTLLAVSKQQPVERIADCLRRGQRCFAESYLQEAVPKIDALAGRGIEWHFIGRLQSNKTAEIARRFDWVQGVDRERIARRLSAQRPPGLPPLNVCVQVNISGDPAKAGLAPEAVDALCDEIDGLPGLRLRGLMAIPARIATPDERRQEFRRLRRLFDELRSAGRRIDTLSMGMSGDFEEAVAEGATMVRLGSALFGARQAAGQPKEGPAPSGILR